MGQKYHRDRLDIYIDRYTKRLRHTYKYYSSLEMGEMTGRKKKRVGCGLRRIIHSFSVRRIEGTFVVG